MTFKKPKLHAYTMDGSILILGVAKKIKPFPSKLSQNLYVGLIAVGRGVAGRARRVYIH